ncbi:ParB/RepB/Spo0J family partition protein [Tenacibaculum agarivorans]|uniref:ParB/RepB/Spo0J family partition protein n=1 Tax=Tenacibaculum agarivorans TaxID=1908389 RepID=UPI00094BAE3C|nr:ParB/RepB/Spo0J family partition protein [Tenacibaculum agarivorans]
MKNLEIQKIALSTISVDENQPRKTFNQEKLEELSKSIKEHGVIEPITLRAQGDGFIIVMGERRYRASLLAGLETIPAMVKEFEDKNILELQLIENLQREDVEPTEEAEGFAKLAEKFSAQEIANRCGKTENFVKQRLKLAGLIEGFKVFVRAGEMTLKLGVAVALFEPEEQEIMLESLENGFNENLIKRMIEQHASDLEKAPFSLEDESLIATVGACNVCPFNAANQGNLFGNGKQVCTKSVCFEAKKQKVLSNLIDYVKEENILLIPDVRSWYLDQPKNQNVLSLMKTKGLKIYLLDSIEYLKKPVKPTKKAIKEDWEDYDYSKEELQEEYDAQIKDYNEEKEVYEQAPSNGYVSGLLLNTNTYKFNPILVRLEQDEEEQEETSSDYVIPRSEKKMADQTPAEQIETIQEKEIRKKQLQHDKQFAEVVNKIQDTDYINKNEAINEDEIAAIAISLYYNNIGHLTRIGSFKDLEIIIAGAKADSTVEKFNAIKQYFDLNMLYKLLRQLLVQQVDTQCRNHTNTLTNAAFYDVMQKTYTKELDEIQKVYTNAEQAREKRIEERITELQKQVADTLVNA